ncbi:hypothetical protein BJF85_06435 [Saccharomonospora sp. CUA-673]|uniref:DUF6292 family protein n=1 Tax=Saccharomonospora sp. CUA-673 TaxID=1904969 RepID=UPI00096385C4|nr:DUF6292 family protein [Saccharomonospora sp. CUA-673]OLT39983.1 hypothetical protein BJF85_06435 [Saccharomonospora sp. CUA-673]
MKHDFVVGFGAVEGAPPAQFLGFRRIRHGRNIEICEVSGELDLLTAPLLGRELTAAVESGVSTLVIDMSRVDFCAVAGVEVLLEACRKVRARTPGVGRGEPHVRRVMSLVAPVDRAAWMATAWFDSVCAAVDEVAGGGSVEAGGLASMDLDSAQRGLRRYVEAVAVGLGVEPTSTWSDVDDLTATAYVALDGRLPGLPDREVALVWDGRSGWALGAETHSGEDLLIRAWFGTERCRSRRRSSASSRRCGRVGRWDSSVRWSRV